MMEWNTDKWIKNSRPWGFIGIGLMEFVVAMACFMKETWFLMQLLPFFGMYTVVDIIWEWPFKSFVPGKKRWAISTVFVLLFYAAYYKLHPAGQMLSDSLASVILQVVLLQLLVLAYTYLVFKNWQREKEETNLG